MKKSKQKSKASELFLDLRPVATSQKKTMTERITERKTVLAVALVVVAMLIIGIVSVTSRGHKTLGKKELAAAKTSVGKHMILPTDEEPTLAQVDDKKAVKDPFIAQKSDNGDQILIYSKNKLVIIYRPSIDKIVAAGDLFADPALTEADGATVTVLNGSNDESKTKSIISKLTALYPKMNVTDGGKTNKQDFSTTIVINNNSNKDNLIESITQSIGAKRGIVPISESASPTNLMIIVGKD